MAFVFMFATLAAVAAPGATSTLHRHRALALDPTAARIATVDSEWVQRQPSAGHGTLVVRDTAGKTIGRYDPCAACTYDGLAWSPEGVTTLRSVPCVARVALFKLTDTGVAALDCSKLR